MGQFLVLNFLLVLGILLALLAWYFYIKAQRFILNSKQIIGKVTDLQSKTGVSISSQKDNQRFVCTPIIEYTTGGKTRTFKSKIYTNTPKYKVGDNVKLLYNPILQKTKENTTFNLYGVTIVIGINAIVLIIVGLIVFNLLPVETRPF